MCFCVLNLPSPVTGLSWALTACSARHQYLDLLDHQAKGFILVHSRPQHQDQYCGVGRLLLGLTYRFSYTDVCNGEPVFNTEVPLSYLHKGPATLVIPKNPAILYLYFAWRNAPAGLTLLPACLNAFDISFTRYRWLYSPSSTFSPCRDIFESCRD